MFIGEIIQYKVSVICHSHLKDQFPVRPCVHEARGVVVFIQHSDMSGAGGAARRRTPIVYDHNKLVAGLLLSV